MNTYAKTKLNKVRKSDRASYDKETVHAVLDEGFLAHVGFVDKDWPMVIPMLYTRMDETLYLHGAPASRMLRTISGGVPVCVAVTLVDGLVLARSAFHHSMNYRSVVAFGHATIVEDADVRTQVLDSLVEHIVAGRTADLREHTDKELRGTEVMAVSLAEASAKVRSGGPIDDPQDMDLPVWAGVLPYRLQAGEPQPAPELAPGLALPAALAALSDEH
jgi:nitroimidazol reductase NimA-like FMN-containing flavoprotein (pyridoxamine 5'-phosphate oxidase superfamily)